jgi:hypothetical protein
MLVCLSGSGFLVGERDVSLTYHWKQSGGVVEELCGRADFF